jgi:hypothetical protein
VNGGAADVFTPSLIAPFLERCDNSGDIDGRYAHTENVHLGIQAQNFCRRAILTRSPITDGQDPVFQNTRLEPFLDQAEHACVIDPMLHNQHSASRDASFYDRLLGRLPAGRTGPIPPAR